MPAQRGTTPVDTILGEVVMPRAAGYVALVRRYTTMAEQGRRTRRP